MNFSPLIPLLEDLPQKAVARELGCSPRQARRIMNTGKAPSAFRDALVNLLDRLIEHSRERLRIAEDELRALRTKEMLERAASRSVASGDKNAPQSEGFGSGAGASQILTGEHLDSAHNHINRVRRSPPT
jgi:hypothetical protein